MAEILYTKTNWVNNVTKLNADNMNHIEDGIETAVTELGKKVTKEELNSAINSAITTTLNTEV